MTQSLDEKAAAIATVLFLLPAHYSMIRIGRNGVHFVNELEQSDMPAGWRPIIPEEFEGWPLEEIKSWFAYQHGLSRKYRLRAVERALRELDAAHHEQAMAVVMECIEGGIFTWYEPLRVSERCRAGLAFMAADVPGDVPWFQEAVVKVAWPSKVRQRNKEIIRLCVAGKTQREIAAVVGCSKNTVGAVLRGKRLLQGRTVALIQPVKVR